MIMVNSLRHYYLKMRHSNVFNYIVWVTAMISLLLSLVTILRAVVMCWQLSLCCLTNGPNGRSSVVTFLDRKASNSIKTNGRISALWVIFLRDTWVKQRSKVYKRRNLGSVLMSKSELNSQLLQLVRGESVTIKYSMWKIQIQILIHPKDKQKGEMSDYF